MYQQSRDHVPVSKFAMIFKRCLVVCFGRIKGRFKISYKNLFVINIYGGPPRQRACFFRTTNSSISRFIIAMDSMIHAILGASNLSKICSGAIKPIIIYMVYFLTLAAFHYKLVEIDVLSMFVSGTPNKGSGVQFIPAIIDPPFVFFYLACINVIYYCAFFLSQRYYNHVLIIPFADWRKQ